jgi:hypothetical protein
MGDFQKAVQHCRDRLCQGQEISDACARVIASLYHEGQSSSSYALASSGATLSSQISFGGSCSATSSWSPMSC